MIASDHLKAKEEEARQEAVELLKKQMAVEGQLIAMYNETAPTFENKAMGHILEMVMLDSRKHIAICQTAIEVLEGVDILSEDKPVLREGLKRHLEIEEGALKRANELLKNVWIRENQALNEMISKLRDDEKRHIETMKRLSKKAFIRLDATDFTTMMRGVEFAEERYKLSKKFREMQKKRE
jgi:rubrerythrin